MKRYNLRSTKQETPTQLPINQMNTSHESTEMESASEGDVELTTTQTDKCIFELKKQILELKRSLAASEEEKLELKQSIALRSKVSTISVNSADAVSTKPHFIYTPSANVNSTDVTSANTDCANVASTNVTPANIYSGVTASFNTASANVSPAYVVCANPQYAYASSVNTNSADGTPASMVCANTVTANVSSADVNFSNVINGDNTNVTTANVISTCCTAANVTYAYSNLSNVFPNTNVTFANSNSYQPIATSNNTYFGFPLNRITYPDAIHTSSIHSSNPNFNQHFSRDNVNTVAANNTPNAYGVYPPFASSQAATQLHGSQPNQPAQPIAMPQACIRKLLDLPAFSGSPEEWPMFFAAFKETTAMYMYTDLENLFRLQKALKGTARQAVESLLIHPSSVGAVISTLEFDFGRPQLLIRSQINKARAFPTITGGKLTDVIAFSTMVNNLTAFLENAGAAGHLTNPTLLDELVSKLPMSKREEWARYTFSMKLSYPSIRIFSNWLKEISMFISIAADVIPQRNSNLNEQLISKSNKAVKPVLVMTEMKCGYCKNNHHLNQCLKFKDIECDQRWKFVKDNHLCFSCLRSGHSAAKCGSRRECGLYSCKRFHNRLLHENGPDKNTVDKATSNEDRDSQQQTEDKTSCVNTIFENEFSKKTLLKFLPVEIKGPRGSYKLMAFIDDGSKISLIEESIAKAVGLKGPQDVLSLSWIGGKTTSELSQHIDIEVSGVRKNAINYQMRNVRTTKKLELPAQTLNFENFKSKYGIANNMPVDDYVNAVPQMLIGMPHINLVRPMEVINLDDCFSIHKSNLGYILFGSNEDSADGVVCRIDYEEKTIRDIQQQVTEYFSLENFGVKPVQPVISEPDKRAEKILLETTKQTGSQYETGLLWSYDTFEFVDSYQMAMRRLETIERKMVRDQTFSDWYKNKIAEYISKSYARKLTHEEAAKIRPHTWYLPHFAVCNVNKNNKLRLVFDAAASINGVCFNSRLMKGPEAYQPKPLLYILFKFRQGPIGVCADIREMFHQVKIREADQEAQRFIWRDGDSRKKPDVYIMTAMIFGSACSPCSAQYIKNFNARKFENDYPRAASAVIDCHYVDDYVDSFESAEEAIDVSRMVKQINAAAGFELRGFLSNSEDVRLALSDQSLAPSSTEMINFCSRESMTEKVLGMYWCSMDDTFCFVLKFSRVPKDVLSGIRRPTKSEVLSLTMSIFDPFGYLANVTIKSKIILQQLWRLNIDWKSPIPEQIYSEWYDWYKGLEQAKILRIPRCYHEQFNSAAAKIELHVFVDASELAYAAVGYWRIVFDGNVRIIFVAGKSRCSPIKVLSIPRLELLAAVLGVRLKDSILSGHDVKPQNVTFWSDSKTVLSWISSDSRCYKQFVAHRIAEILDSSDVNWWRWVPGKHNPADDATRLQATISATSRWINGPTFLNESEEKWPVLSDGSVEIACDIERRSKHIFAISIDSTVIDFKQFSNYYKLLRVISWVRRAILKFKTVKKKELQKSFSVSELQLNATDINETETLIYRVVQSCAYADEIRDLTNGDPVSKNSSLFNLTAVLDEEGVLRHSGRIDNAECVPLNTKRPIILPSKHPLSNLIARHYHEKYKHQKQDSIICAIRRKFWISNLRRIVTSAAKECQLCKNRKAEPRPPLMGQLPKDRVAAFVRVFSYTGVDFFGPYLVAVGRRQEKRWGCLFTCLTVRAIHLELAKDLSADAFILCLRNFINRRGVPIRMRSDRGTNFVGASKEESVLVERGLVEEGTRRGIEWVFNSPGNPSAGGCWERMVRCVKRVLSFTLNTKVPQVETLQSLLIEAENLVNSRPLTYLPLDGEDAEPLTPNHFILGCPNDVQTPSVDEGVCLRKQWHILQQMKQTFWKRWVLEYLPTLTRRSKWCQREEPLKVGDVVLVCDENERRGEWKRGIIVEIFPAPDGQVRSAVVKTNSGTLRRPASKLAVLDVVRESSGTRSIHGGRDVAE